MEILRTMIHGEVVFVQPAMTHIEYSDRGLNDAAHLGGPPHELLRQLEACTIVCKHARLVDEYPGGISNTPGVLIFFCDCLALLLLPFGRQGLCEDAGR